MKDDVNFPAIPSKDQLQNLERDLSFHRIKTESPAKLNKKQIDDFNRHGFVAPLTIFDDLAIQSIRVYFDQLLEQVTKAGGNSYSISTAHLKYREVYDILTDQRIVGYVKDILGDDVIGWGSHFFCKMPGDGKRVAWHQDASYWPMSKSKNVTVWLAVDDADIENRD